MEPELLTYTMRIYEGKTEAARLTIPARNEQEARNKYNYERRKFDAAGYAPEISGLELRDAAGKLILAAGDRRKRG